MLSLGPRPQAGKHLHHAPDDATRGRSETGGPAGENISAPCGAGRQHVSGGHAPTLTSGHPVSTRFTESYK